LQEVDVRGAQTKANDESQGSIENSFDHGGLAENRERGTHRDDYSGGQTLINLEGCIVRRVSILSPLQCFFIFN